MWWNNFLDLKKKSLPALLWFGVLVLFVSFWFCFGFVWTCFGYLVLLGCVCFCLCLVLFVWMCFGFVWFRRLVLSALFGCVFFCLALLGCVWFCLVLSCCVWFCLAVFGFVLFVVWLQRFLATVS